MALDLNMGQNLRSKHQLNVISIIIVFQCWQTAAQLVVCFVYQSFKLKCINKPELFRYSLPFYNYFAEAK